MIIQSILLLFVLGNGSIAELVSLPKKTYRASVVEFPRFSNSTNYAVQTGINADLHVQVMRKQLEGRGIDVLVFPEAVLNYMQTAIRVPKPKEKKVACNDETQPAILRDISCAVRDLKSYVVVHSYIETNCTEDRIETNDTRPCTNAEKDINIYNSALVFDRTGAIIAVYRKYNLFGESSLQTPLIPDEVVFETDFGVRFGVFICFDMLFNSPALDLVRKGIQHFVYPTFWFSELPYLTALQTQNMWAYTHNAVLLAAGANVPGISTTGSGIYNGRRGPIHTVLSDRYQLRTIITDISMDRESDKNNEIDEDISSELPTTILPGLRILSENLTEFNVHFLNFKESTTQTGEVTHKGVRCVYDISVTDRQASDAEHFSYAVAAFDGKRGYFATKVKTAFKICSIISCTRPGSVESCAVRLITDKPVRERYIYDRLKLEAIIAQEDGSQPPVAMANTVNRQMKPLQSQHFNFEVHRNENEQKATLQLTQPRDDVQTFAIYARDFQSDEQIDEPGWADSEFKIEL